MKTLLYLCTMIDWRMKKNIGTFVLLILVGCGSLAAQPRLADEQGNLNYRDYELLINPATAGILNSYFTSVSINKQWVSIDNSPLAELLQFQMPLAKSSGLGAWVYNESYGVQTNTQLAMSYAYKVKLNSHTLSFGLNASLLLLNESRVTDINDPFDPVFAEALGLQAGFNAGFGACYHGENFYAGFSIPQLLTNDLKTNKLEDSFDFSRLQYYFTGGYNFNLNEKFSLMPTALLAVSGATDFGYECMLNAAYDKRFELGAGWAAHNRLQISAGATIVKGLSLRYQYSENFGSDYSHTGSSHFVVVRFAWGNQKKTEPAVVDK